MKTVKQQIMNGLLIGLATTSLSLKAQSIQLTDPAPKVSSFEVGTYIDAHKKLTLVFGSKESKRLRVTLKDSKQSIIHQYFIKSGSTSFTQKFDFDEAKSGMYELEVSDGSQTVVRKVEIVDIQPQRFITYGPQAGM